MMTRLFVTRKRRENVVRARVLIEYDARIISRRRKTQSNNSNKKKKKKKNLPYMHNT